MNALVREFLSVHYGQQSADSLFLLAQSGSSRKYYRFYSENQSFILTGSENIEENQSFFYFSRHFSTVVDNLPRIEKISDDFKIYVQTDLGDLSLLNLLEKNRAEAKPLFEQSIRNLVKLQVLGDSGLDYTKCFSYPKFNYLLVLRDLFSFKNYFLNLSGIEFNHGRLLNDFERFSNDFEQIKQQYFVYRDFQSRNIMIHDGKPFFIDYQGGLKGPVQYDLVSLIWQAKADLSEDWKNKFYDLYVHEFKEVSQQNLNESEFRNGYELCLIERLLQVLGTYGFRGIFERKPHFLNSIEFGLKNLNQIKDLDLMKNYPEMKAVVQKLSELNPKKLIL